MREKEEPSAIWREEKEPVRPNTYLQKTKKKSTKTGGDGTTTKTTTYAKKIYANLSQKKKESTVFSILPFAKIVLPTIKKTPSTIISKSRIHISKWYLIIKELY